MNGLLSEHPLAELIREISEKGFSGALRLEHERVKAVVYFEKGSVAYAASNVRPLRLREYLVGQGLVSSDELARFGDRRSDLELAGLLTREGVLTRANLGRVQTKQVADVLRLAITWSSGTWEFDARSHLQEEVNVRLELPSLLLEASRNIAVAFAASRFRNASEIISPAGGNSQPKNLLPHEGFLLSRIERPMGLSEVVALSGQPEQDALRLTYSLALGGLLQRERWNHAFRSGSPQVPSPLAQTPHMPTASTPVSNQTPADKDSGEDIETFVKRILKAPTHYMVLGVTSSSTTQEVKSAYYKLARRYHPDRFRHADNALKVRIDAAFARVTQAYDALRDSSLRAAYDSKLDGQTRAEDLAKAAPKASEPVSSTETATGESQTSAGETSKTSFEVAEEQFKQGYAALQLGQLNVALGLFSNAARSMPGESRYRAYYGQALSRNSHTRRLAESELQAAIKLEPTNSDYRTMLAELYLDLGFPVRARSELERALARDPGHQKAKELLRNLKAGS